MNLHQLYCKLYVSNEVRHADPSPCNAMLFMMLLKKKQTHSIVQAVHVYVHSYVSILRIIKDHKVSLLIPV